MDRMADVVVVGAGLSGLYAARLLKRAGLTVTVLEARDRLGGRVFSQKLANGAVIDLGGQWIGPGQRRMYALAQEYGLKTTVTHTQGDVIYSSIHGPGQLQRASGKIPPMSWLGKLDSLQLSWRIGFLLNKLMVDQPLSQSSVSRLDRQSFNQWLQHNTFTPEARLYWQQTVESGICASGDRVSPMEILQQISTIGGLNKLDSAEYEFFVDGAQALAYKMAEELGCSICLNTPVRSLKQQGNLVYVTTDQGEFVGKHVILALPPQLIGDIKFDDSLDTIPEGHDDRVLGQVIKTLIVYDHAWWRNQGLSGVANTPHEIIDFLADSSSPDGQPGILVALASGTRAAQLSQMNEEHRNSAVLSYIHNVLGEPSGRLIDVVSMDWIAEPFSRGGYASRRAVGGWSSQQKLQAQRSDQVHVAGTETASEWRSYMEGALQSAERASADILMALDLSHP